MIKIIQHRSKNGRYAFTLIHISRIFSVTSNLKYSQNQNNLHLCRCHTMLGATVPYVFKVAIYNSQNKNLYLAQVSCIIFHYKGQDSIIKMPFSGSQRENRTENLYTKIQAVGKVKIKVIKVMLAHGREYFMINKRILASLSSASITVL